MTLRARALGRLLLLVLLATWLVGPAALRVQAQSRWAPTRTPWGDPDLQGAFSNSNEYATPLERPDRFAGQIFQTPGFVVITYEIVHEARIIPLDGRPHLGPSIHQHMGDARGRWDGSTLVIETTNFARESAYRGANPATLRVTERFTRTGPDRIEWTATLDDPSTWTRRWTIAMPLTSEPHGVMAFECHEGNYGLRNILSAAREEEKTERAK